MRHVCRMFDPVEKLKEFIRYPSVSTDSKFKDGMKGARSSSPGSSAPRIQSGRRENGEAPDHLRAARRREKLAARADLRALRRAAGDPLNLWKTPAFEPTIVGNRIYGRGAADKQRAAADEYITAIAAVGGESELPLRITFLVEGEEEMGSPSFPKFLETHADRLREADFVFLSDTALPNENQVVLTCGLRGLFFCAVRRAYHGREGRTAFRPARRRAAQPDPGAGGNPRDAAHAGRQGERAGFSTTRWPGRAPVEREELKKLGANEKGMPSSSGSTRSTRRRGFRPFESVRFNPRSSSSGIGGATKARRTKTVIQSKAFARSGCRARAKHAGAGQDQKTRCANAITARCPKRREARVRRQHKGDPYVSCRRVVRNPEEPVARCWRGTFRAMIGRSCRPRSLPGARKAVTVL